MNAWDKLRILVSSIVDAMGGPTLPAPLADPPSSVPEQAPSIAPTVPASIIEPPAIIAPQEVQQYRPLKGKQLAAARKQIMAGPHHRKVGVYWLEADGTESKVMEDEHEAARPADEFVDPGRPRWVKR